MAYPLLEGHDRSSWNSRFSELAESWLQSLEKLLERAVAPGNKLAPAAEAALLQLVDDFLGGAVAFGCGLARRRKAGRLESADIAAYLERTW